MFSKASYISSLTCCNPIYALEHLIEKHLCAIKNLIQWTSPWTMTPYSIRKLANKKKVVRKVKYLGASENNLARHKNEQHNLGLLHSIDQSWKQFRLILQPTHPKFSGARHRNTQKITGLQLIKFPQSTMHPVPLYLHQITTLWIRSWIPSSNPSNNGFMSKIICLILPPAT